MRSLAAFLALAVVAGVVLAGGHTVAGVVLDSNGKPLEGVKVRVARSDPEAGYRSLEAETDGKGRFSIEGVDSGTSRVSIQSLKPGDRFSLWFPDIEVAREKEDLKLRLSKSEITGKITLKETGKPPPESPQISLYQVKPWTVAGMAWMGEGGEYRLRGFPPGAYQVRVFLTGYRKAMAEVVVKKNQKKKGVDFVLEPLESGTVRFKVEDVEGKPLEGVDFSYASEPGITSTLQAKEIEPGVYECTQLETGTWKVYLSRKDLRVKTLTVEVKAGETTEIQATMHPK